MTRRARSFSRPMTMRSGCLKSAIAAPSRRNSGLDTTANRSLDLCSAMICSTSSPAPIGTVDLITMTVKSSMTAAIARAAP